MEKLIALFGIFFFAATVTALPPCSPEPPIMSESAAECQKEHFDSATGEAFLDDPTSDVEGLKRFKECIFTKLGFIKDNKLSIDAIKEFFTKHTNNKEALKNIIELLQRAAEEANRSDNVLDVSHVFFKKIFDKERQEPIINREFC